MKITKEGIAILEDDTHISKWVEETGRLDHDQNMLPIVLSYINEGDLVLDCGAFIGDHTVAYLEKVGPSGKVIAIEPSLRAFGCLLHNTKKYANCYHYNRAVGDKDEFRVSLKYDDNAGANHVIAGNGIRGCSIDSLKLEKCDFIKLDVEGFEVKALYGATTTIMKFKPKLLIEVNYEALKRQGNTPEQLFSFLHGYKIKNIYEGQKMEGPQYDIICTP